MRKKDNKAWVWLVGALLASTLNLGCASVQTGGAAKEEEKPVAELADASAKSGNFWKDDEVIMKFGSLDLNYTDMKRRCLDWTGGKALTLLPKPQQERFFSKYYYEKLFAQEARVRGIEKSQDFLDHTRAKKFRILEPLYKVKEIAGKIKPTDEYLRSMLPPAEDEVRVRVIVKEDIRDAKAVYARALAGEDFEALVKAESEGLQREGGGLSPFLSKHNSQKYPMPVVERYLAQNVGVILEPFYMDIGFLIVKIVDKRSAEEITKMELENQRSQLLFKVHSETFDRRLKELKERAVVVQEVDVINSFAKNNGDPGAVILTIDGNKFLASEVLEDLIEARHGGQPILQRINRFIDTALVAAEAERLGYDKDPDFVRSWTELEDQELARALSREETRRAAKEPIEQKELEEFLKANPDKFKLPEERDVYMIMTADPKKAEKVSSELASGIAFGQLASEYSEDPASAQNSGSIGWFEKAALPAPLREQVFALAEKAFTPAPIEALSDKETPLWFFFYVDGVRKDAPAPIERVNMRTVEGKLRTHKASKSLSELVYGLEKKFGYELCIGDKMDERRNYAE